MEIIREQSGLEYNYILTETSLRDLINKFHIYFGGKDGYTLLTKKYDISSIGLFQDKNKVNISGMKYEMTTDCLKKWNKEQLFAFSHILEFPYDVSDGIYKTSEISPHNSLRFYMLVKDNKMYPLIY